MALIRKYLEYYPNIPADTYLAETAIVIGRVTVGEDANIWDGAVVRGDTGFVSIGKGVSIQENTVIHVGAGEGENTIIGNHSLIGHASIIHGCEIEENCLIGMGAIIMNRAHINKNSIVAAGSIVTEGKAFPPNSLIMGSPAKTIRVLEEVEIEKIRENINHYILLAKNYQKMQGEQ